MSHYRQAGKLKARQGTTNDQGRQSQRSRQGDSQNDHKVGPSKPTHHWKGGNGLKGPPSSGVVESRHNNKDRGGHRQRAGGEVRAEVDNNIRVAPMNHMLTAPHEVRKEKSARVMVDYSCTLDYGEL